jgi:hypothetical protein
VTSSLFTALETAYKEQRAKLTRLTDEEYTAYAQKWQARAKEEAAKVGGEHWPKWLAVFMALGDEALVRLQGRLQVNARLGSDDDKAWLAQQLRYFYEQREGGR